MLPPQVTGDRRPEEVYQDFRHVFFSIIRSIEEKRESQDQTPEDRAGGECVELGDTTVLWVVGGPGSKKFERVSRAMREFKNWKVISTGEELYDVYRNIQMFCSIEGQLFWDYLKKIDEKTDVSDDDSANNNIVNENKQITKTLTEMLEHGNLVPDVSFTDLLFQCVSLMICFPLLDGSC